MEARKDQEREEKAVAAVAAIAPEWSRPMTGSELFRLQNAETQCVDSPSPSQDQAPQGFQGGVQDVEASGGDASKPESEPSHHPASNSPEGFEGLQVDAGKPESEPKGVQDAPEQAPPPSQRVEDLATKPKQGSAPEGKERGSMCGKTGKPAPKSGTGTPGSALQEKYRDAYVDPREKAPPPHQHESKFLKRLRRVCTPKESGELKVPQEVIKDFQNLESRARVLQLFEKVGYEPVRWACLQACSIG